MGNGRWENDMGKRRAVAKSRLADDSYAFRNNNSGEVLTTEESAIIDDGSTLRDDGMAVLNRKMCHRSVCIKGLINEFCGLLHLYIPKKSQKFSRKCYSKNVIV